MTTQTINLEAGVIWYLENAAKKHTSKNTQLTIEDIHAISLHNSRVANKAISDSFITSYKYCGEKHKQGLCQDEYKSCH